MEEKVVRRLFDGGEMLIRSVSNGYSVHVLNDEGYEEEVLFQDSDEGLESFKDLLGLIIEYYGKSGSRYDKERLKITTEPGDKV